MADLIGTATIRVGSNTTDAARAIRQFATRADRQLRDVQQRVGATARDLSRLRGTTVSVTVNDRTAAGLAAVRTAVDDLRRLGPVRIPVQINDGTRRGARAVQTTVASLQRLGPIRIGADIDVDPAAAAAAAAALRDLQQAARSAARALATLATRATTATAALAALGAAARSLRGDMDELDGSIRRTGGGMTGLRGRLGTLSTSASSTGSAINGLRTAALALAPALVPIAVQAAPIAAGLTAAGAAVTAFAVAAGGQVAALSEAADAEKKYQDAVDEHGSRSEQAIKAQAEFQRQIAQMPPATRTAAAALSSFKDAYEQWSNALAGDTMPVVTKSFAAFGALLPKLTPVVQGASAQLNRFVTIAAGGIQSPGFDRFMRSFADFSTGALARANDALIRFTRTLDAGQVSGGVSQFMEYVRANGPLVRDTLSSVGDALSTIIQGAADVGPGLLTVVNALAGLVAALPPGVITAMLQLALALKAVRLAAAGAAAISTGVTAFTAAIGGMRTAAAGATGVLPRLGAAFMALSRTVRVAVAGTGIGLLLIALTELSRLGQATPPDVDKLTSSLRQLGSTSKATGEAARVFGSDLDGLYGKVRSLTDPSTTDKVQQFLVGWSGWDSTPVQEARENLDAVDVALANLVKNNQADLAAAAVKRLTAEYGKGGRDTKEFTSRLDDYKAAQADARREQQLAAEAMSLFGQQAQSTSAKLAEQKQSADGLRQAIQALNDVNRSALGGMIGFEAAVDAASKAAQENAGVLSMQGEQLVLNTEKQRAAAQSLNDLAAKTDEAASAARESGQAWGSVNSIYERGRQQLIANAQQMGLTRAEAEKLASQILKTPNKTALLKADISDWKTKISEAEKQLRTAKGDKKAKLTADIADWRVKVAQAEKQLLGAKATKQARLTADIGVWQAKVAQAERQLKTAKGDKKARLTADIADWQSKISTARGAVNSLPQSKTVYLTSVYTSIIRTKRLGPGDAGYGVVAPGGATGGLYTGHDFKHRGKGYAGGGLVDGPGTGTSDSVFAPWLSAREFVVNAKQTAKYLPLLRAINDGRVGMGSLGVGAATRTRSRDLGVNGMRATGAAASTTVNITVRVDNQGVIGSPLEVENFLSRALDNLSRTGRLPSSLRSA